MSFDFVCNRDRILLDVPHQIWEASTADGTGGVFITRLLHNKVIFYSNNFLRCYLAYLSPEVLATVWTIVGTLIFFSGIYFAVSRRNFPVLALILLSPLFPLLQITDQRITEAVILYGSQAVVLCYGLYQILINGRKYLINLIYGKNL